jgi:hypothetical protein
MSDYCEIVVKGQLDPDWSGWFEGLTITHNDQGETILAGPIRDQAALHGLLAKVRNMGLFLLSVRCVIDGSWKDPLNPDDPSGIQGTDYNP